MPRHPRSASRRNPDRRKDRHQSRTGDDPSGLHRGRNPQPPPHGVRNDALLARGSAGSPPPSPRDRRRQRLEFLVEAGELLGSSLDYADTLRQVAGLLVPRFADWCVIDIAGDGGVLERLAVTHADPGKQRMAAELHHHHPPSPNAARGPDHVFRTGEPEQVERITDPLLAELARDGGHLAALSRLGLRSYVCVPLCARGRTLGTLTLVTAESGRCYDADDLPFAQAIASRAAMAIDNARLYETAEEELRERRRAERKARRQSSSAWERFNELQTLMQLVPVGVAVARDPLGRDIVVNREAASMLGIPTGTNVSLRDPASASHPFRILRSGREATSSEIPVYRAIDHGETVRGEEFDIVRGDGTVLTFRESASPLHDHDGVVRGAVGVIMDVTEHQRSERLLEARARRLEATAEIAEAALRGVSLKTVLDTATRAVAHALDVELCSVLELQPDGRRLVLRSGTGGTDEQVGRTVQSTGRASQAGFTLMTGEPVVVADLSHDKRFVPSALLREQGAVSGASVVISGDGRRPFGVLGVHARQPRRFSDEECRFLQSAADTLANIIRERRIADFLRESRERLQFTLDAAMIGTWVWDIPSNSVHWSESMNRIYGHESSPHPGGREAPLEDALQTGRESTHPEDRDRLLAAIEKALETGEPQDLEYRIIRPRDGQLRWVELKGQVSRDERGQPMRFHGICMDITDRKLREQNQAHLVEIVASSSAAIIGHTLDDGVVTSWNAGAEQLFGYCAEEMIGSSIAVIVPEECRPDFDRCWAAVARGERIEQIETMGRRSDGSLVHVVLSAGPVAGSDGRPLGVAVVMHDISERKRMELALRESEERFRLIADSSAVDLIFLTRPDGRIVYASPSFRSVLGHEPSELQDRCFLDLVHPGDRKRFARWPSPELPSFRGLRSDGKWLWMEGSSYAISSDSGDYVVGIVRDISDRKERELQLQHKAWHDPLTGLPNRELFYDRLLHLIERGNRDSVDYAVLLLDLDDFKSVNDTLGHLAGDELLIEFCRRVRCCLRPSDTLSRFGGDEFALLLEDAGGREGVLRVAERIRAETGRPFLVASRALVAGTSIGAVLGDTGFCGPEDPLSRADAALYRAKREGKGRLAFFDRQSDWRHVL